MSFVGKVGVPSSVLNTFKKLSHFIPMTVLGGVDTIIILILQTRKLRLGGTVAFQDHTSCKWWVWGSRKLLLLRLCAEFSPHTVNEGGR